jgi:hypothetical protein
MTAMTDKTLQIEDSTPLHKIKLYGDKRFFRSIACSVIVSIGVGDWSYALLIYPFATVFWDWWFFSYHGIKESTNLPEWFLAWKKISREQIDQYVTITMYIKRVILVLSLILACIHSFKDTSMFSIDLFMIYILLMALVMIPALCFKALKTPYVTFRWGSTSSRNTSPLFEDRFYDPCDPTNPAGYYNPSSINYRFK